jgi:hypothetical protein
MTDETRLPFALDQQDAALHHFLNDNGFRARVRGWLRPEYFNDVRTGKLCVYAMEFQEVFGRAPTRSELSAHVRHREPGIEGEALAKKLDALSSAGAQYGLDFLSRNLVEWRQARIYREAIEKSSAAFNKGDFDLAYALFRQFVPAVESVSRGDVPDFNFTDLHKVLVEADADFRDALTTGSAALNDALLPRARRGQGLGALLRGRTTVVVAPASVGKTTTLVTMLVANVRAGRSVLYLTHEGVPRTLLRKMTCCYLGVDEFTLARMASTPEGKARIDELGALLSRQVVFGPDVGMTIEKVREYIEWKQQERIAQTGKGFDLLVDDYPAILDADDARGGKDAVRREVDETTYRSFVKLARDHGFHALVAVQTNRHGSKKNRGGEDVVALDDIAECFAVAMAADNVITLNRRPSDGTRMMFFVAKCREGEAETYVFARSNFAAGISHSDSLGAAYTWKHLPLTDQMDAVIEEFNGRELPREVVNEFEPEPKPPKKGAPSNPANDSPARGTGFGSRKGWG